MHYIRDERLPIFSIEIHSDFKSSFRIKKFYSLKSIEFQVAPDVREYSLSAASIGDTLGVNIAAFLAIVLHNGICKSWRQDYDDYIYS